MPSRLRRTAITGAPCLALALLAVTGCSSGGTSGTAQDDRPGSLRATTAPGAAPTGTQATPPPAPAAAGSPVPSAAPAAAPSVAPLTTRRSADVRVVATTMLPQAVRARLIALSAPDSTVTYRAGTVLLAGRKTSVVGVDASQFRAYTAEATAASDAVWQAVARGEAVVSHEAQRTLALGAPVDADAVDGPRRRVTLRLGALATTGIPGADLVVDDQVAGRLGVPIASGMLLTAPEGTDPVAFAADVREVAGSAAVDLVRTPAPVARLTGGEAAQELGAFSYRYFADGSIQPDARWVRDNIRTETVPIFGRVTCHRLMLTQLRGALQEVVDAGLSGSLKTYDGCYVPRFIERNPSRSISLHTWGIAIDLDAATNYRGIRGTMDPRVVAIFKRWGFNWGGDWTYTDPMHFELGSRLTTPTG